MIGNRDPEAGFFGVFQIIVAASNVVDKKTCSLECPEDNLGFESR